jgi:hypothetical protein
MYVVIDVWKLCNFGCIILLWTEKRRQGGHVYIFFTSQHDNDNQWIVGTMSAKFGVGIDHKQTYSL